MTSVSNVPTGEYKVMWKSCERDKRGLRYRFGGTIVIDSLSLEGEWRVRGRWSGLNVRRWLIKGRTRDHRCPISVRRRLAFFKQDWIFGQIGEIGELKIVRLKYALIILCSSVFFTFGIYICRIYSSAWPAVITSSKRDRRIRIQNTKRKGDRYQS